MLRVPGLKAEILKDELPVITLTLLHPLQSGPVQSWTFNTESAIRVGRSNENDVILYSAVVSRHHVEVRPKGHGWEVVSLGANGTYVDGERVTQVPVVDGMIIRLASSGPKIQIRLGAVTTEESDSQPQAAASMKSSSPRSDEPMRETYLTVRSTETQVEDI